MLYRKNSNLKETRKPTKVALLKNYFADRWTDAYRALAKYWEKMGGHCAMQP